MIEYPKIETLYTRSEITKKLIEGEFRNPAVEYLKDNEWIFTEKIDGTNISVEWDGHNVSFHGRTAKADIPKHLLTKLEELFSGETNEEMFEQLFGAKHVILYGEGYGAKIQKGEAYRNDVSFILFDVYFPESDIWLQRVDAESVAKFLGIEVVPVILDGTIEEAVKMVKSHPSSTIGSAKMEGLVGVPLANLKDRLGERIIVKIKVRDFE